MSRTFLPKAHYLALGGTYRPMFRYYKESPWALVPGAAPCATAGQALAAADAYMEQRLNPTIRSEVTEARDVLGIAQWHEERAARQAEQQEQALGAIIIKGRQIKVERRQRA